MCLTGSVLWVTGKQELCLCSGLNMMLDTESGKREVVFLQRLSLKLNHFSLSVASGLPSLSQASVPLSLKLFLLPSDLSISASPPFYLCLCSAKCCQCLDSHSLVSLSSAVGCHSATLSHSIFFLPLFSFLVLQRVIKSYSHYLLVY